MRTLGVACALVVTLLLPGAALAAWQEPVGGPRPLNAEPNGQAAHPTIADVDGVPVVAWNERTGNQRRVRLSRFDGVSVEWRAAPPATPALLPTFADEVGMVVIAGHPIVVYDDYDNGQHDVRAAYLDGDTWRPLGGTVDNAEAALSPSIGVLGGSPVVAWSEFIAGSGYRIRVARFDGQDWVRLGTPLGQGYVESPRLTTVGNDLYVTWREQNPSNFEVQVARYDTVTGTWTQPEPGDSPINADTSRDAHDPVLASIGGRPHVAWTEDSDSGRQVRVARLIGNHWDEIVGGPTPINTPGGGEADNPALADIGGRPWLAWKENGSVRVARLNAATTAWDQVATANTPLATVGGSSQGQPSLAAVDDIPYLAWIADEQVRVARLEPDFSLTTALTAEKEAFVMTSVRGYSVPYAISFQYGPGFASQTGGEVIRGDSDTVVRRLTGLTPATTYEYRPVADLGLTGPLAFGAPGTFTTPSAAPAPSSTSVQGDSGAPDGSGVPQSPGAAAETQVVHDELLVALFRARHSVRAGRTVSFDYVATAGAAVTLEIKRRGKTVARVTGTAKSGRNRLRWKAKRRGRYTVVLTATAGDGQTASDTGKLTVKRKR